VTGCLILSNKHYQDLCLYGLFYKSFNINLIHFSTWKLAWNYFKIISEDQHFTTCSLSLKYFWNNSSGWNNFISFPCQIKHWNNFENISVIHFTCNQGLRKWHYKALDLLTGGLVWSKVDIAILKPAPSPTNRFWMHTHTYTVLFL